MSDRPAGCRRPWRENPGGPLSPSPTEAMTMTGSPRYIPTPEQLAAWRAEGEAQHAANTQKVIEIRRKRWREAKRRYRERLRLFSGPDPLLVPTQHSHLRVVRPAKAGSR